MSFRQLSNYKLFFVHRVEMRQCSKFPPQVMPVDHWPAMSLPTVFLGIWTPCTGFHCVILTLLRVVSPTRDWTTDNQDFAGACWEPSSNSLRRPNCFCNHNEKGRDLSLRRAHWMNILHLEHHCGTALAGRSCVLLSSSWDGKGRDVSDSLFCVGFIGSCGSSQPSAAFGVSEATRAEEHFFLFFAGFAALPGMVLGSVQDAKALRMTLSLILDPSWSGCAVADGSQTVRRPSFQLS